MNNRIPYIVIILLLLVVLVGGGAYFILNGTSKQKTETNNNPYAAPSQNNSVSPAAPSQPLSEQPNQAVFNAYFADASLAKLPGGVQFAPDAVVKTSLFDFVAGDEFCTSLDVIKSIPKNLYADAVYDTNAKSYAIPRRATPRPLAIGNSIGCERLLVGQNKPLPSGKYEYKAYVNNVLAIVLPFAVK